MPLGTRPATSRGRLIDGTHWYYIGIAFFAMISGMFGPLELRLLTMVSPGIS
jgi:hypothetical protein